MPKLGKKQAQSVAEQEVKDFTAIPPGRYVLALREVTVSDKPGESGAHYWNWEFEVVEPEVVRDPETKEDVKVVNRRLWTRTSLADSAEWKLKQVFDAFGYTPDSDTDEMVSEKVVAYVARVPQEKGQRQGQLVNEIDRLAPYDESEEREAAEADEGDQF